jgi:hypothetical protein
MTVRLAGGEAATVLAVAQVRRAARNWSEKRGVKVPTDFWMGATKSRRGVCAGLAVSG